MTGVQLQPGAAQGVARMSRSHASTGRIYFWQGGSLWIGVGRGCTEWHDHHAHQVALVPDGVFRFRTAAEGGWESFEGALVPSHCSHQFEIEGLEVAHLFVEPESRAGRALARRHGTDAVARLDAAACRAIARELFGAFGADASGETMVAAAQAATAALSGTTTEPDQQLDPRLARALAYMHEHLDRPLALGGVVALSESRFRHLFVAGTGSSFRAYLLWLRINRAIEAVQAGASWTDAAHAAGFADSAHLTRTHRRMFGIEPSAIRPAAPPAQAAGAFTGTGV